MYLFTAIFSFFEKKFSKNSKNYEKSVIGILATNVAETLMIVDLISQKNNCALSTALSKFILR